MTSNHEWKRNRNLYAVLLLDMVINKKLEKPFVKVPPEGSHLDTLNPAEVKAKLSAKVKGFLGKSGNITITSQLSPASDTAGSKKDTRVPRHHVRMADPPSVSELKSFECDTFSNEENTNQNFDAYLQPSSPNTVTTKPQTLNVELTPTITEPEFLKVVVPQCNCSDFRNSAQSELV